MFDKFVVLTARKTIIRDFPFILQAHDNNWPKDVWMPLPD
jgi:hypothetical protein